MDRGSGGMKYILFFIFTFSAVYGNSLSEKIYYEILKDSKFIVEGEKIQGEWTYHDSWYEFFCPTSNYNYKILSESVINSIKFELQEDGSIDVYSSFSNIWGKIDGMYKASYTFCYEISNSIGIGADEGEVLAKIIFPDNGSIPENFNIEVIYTRIYYLRIHPNIPDWMSLIFSKSLNIVTETMWRSSIGKWLNEVIVEFIKKEINEI